MEGQFVDKYLLGYRKTIIGPAPPIGFSVFLQLSAIERSEFRMVLWTAHEGTDRFRECLLLLHRNNCRMRGESLLQKRGARSGETDQKDVANHMVSTLTRRR